MSGTTTEAGFAIASLAAFATSLGIEEVPAEVRASAGDMLADAVACAVFGARFPWSAAVRAQTSVADAKPLPLDPSPSPESRRGEALVWGVQAHAFELDSLRKPGAGVHPGATVALPALAMAIAGNAAGRDLVRAIVAGCEVMFRIGAATLHTPEKRGFHAPGITGPFGAAVAAGVLLGLSEGEMANALGIAASLGGGLLAFSRSAGGGMVKRLHLGRAAEAGLLAAQLAHAGYEGPESALEGRFGLIEAYCNESDAAALTAGLGERWETRTLCLKRYACHVTAHPPVDALRRLMRAEGFAGGDIARITLAVSPKVASHHASRRPGDLMQAQYSVPFMLATAAYHDLSDPRVLAPDILADAAVLDLCDRTTLVERGGELKGWEADLEIELSDGRRFAERAAGFPGTPDTPMTPAELEDKFTTLVRDDLEDPAGALAALRSLGTAASVRDLWRSIT